MKRKILLSLLAVLAAFVLPILLSAAPVRKTEGEAATEPPEAGDAPVPDAGGIDAATPLRLHTDSGDVEMTMADYLPRALAAEMPASFGEEALKAQAVALRTYALYFRDRRKRQHPEADVCTSPACCAAYLDEAQLLDAWGGQYGTYRDRLEAAVRATDGQYLAWERAPVYAVFHAASYGRTEDGAALGLTVPYLCSVSSPETAGEVENLRTTVEVSAADFRNTVLGAFPGAALPEGDPASWVGAAALNAAGRVAEVRIGGVSVSGLALRQMFGLRSTDFTLAWDGGGQRFVFRVNGYGHGLGMSQHGADLMARGGAVCAEILAHYYPGTELMVWRG